MSTLITRSMDGNRVAGLIRESSDALEKSHIMKAKPCKLLMLFGYNSGGAQFLQLFDSATLPADGTVPSVAPIPIEAAKPFSIAIGICGIPFDTGLVVCNSSTAGTKTIGADDCWFTGILA